MSKIKIEIEVGDGKYCFINRRNCEYLAEPDWCKIFNKPVPRTRIGAMLRHKECLDAVEVKHV
jgi:hypothetical protein